MDIEITNTDIVVNRATPALTNEITLRKPKKGDGTLIYELIKDSLPSTLIHRTVTFFKQSISKIHALLLNKAARFVALFPDIYSLKIEKPSLYGRSPSRHHTEVRGWHTKCWTTYSIAKKSVVYVLLRLPSPRITRFLGIIQKTRQPTYQ